MSGMKRGFFFLVQVFFLLCFPCLMTLADNVSPVLQQEKMAYIKPLLDDFITKFLKKTKAPGCVIALIGPQEVYFLKTYGVKQLGKSDPLTENTLFQLGSVSKPLTATLAVFLQTQNRLSLETPISTYLPEFKLQGQTKPLYLKHLLSHTSGVPRQGFNALIESTSTRQDLYKKAQNTPLVAQPGLSFDYHNVMFSLTEDVLKASTKESFEKLLQNHLFKPLKMPYACVGLQTLKNASNRASPHVKNKRGKLYPLKKYSQTYYKVLGSAGMNASMKDLIPFLQLHLGGFPKLLTSEGRSLLHTSQITEESPPPWLKNQSEHIGSTGYALGWRWVDYKGERVLYHGGWLNGFHPIIAFLPQHEIGIIILHNAETHLPMKTLLKFLDLYLDI